MKHLNDIRKSLITFVLIILFISGLINIAIVYGLQLNNMITSIDKIPFVILIISLLLSFIFSSILTIFFSKTVLKPLQELIAATKQIRKGNFNIRIPTVKSFNNKKTEISDLIENFNLMSEELASIELFKNDFINNFSHEFKTPIASIIGFAKELERDDLSEEEKHIYLSIIIKESSRLATLSSNILLLTKLENQTIITNQTYFSLDEQIRNTILLMQEDWENKNLELDLSLDSVSYHGNEELISQVWINLINNAIKFSNQNGTIKIRLSQQDSQIIVTISDNGIGMDKKLLEHIFDKFYQGDSSRSTNGNGLGLSLVKKILDLSNGTISVTSQVDKGSTFTVILNI